MQITRFGGPEVLEIVDVAETSPGETSPAGPRRERSQPQGLTAA